MISLGHYDDQELLEICDEYAEDHPSFNTEFIDSLKDALEEYDELTCGQRSALENIIKKFRMK